MAFTNRNVEEEIRVEVDRDAAMLKAFSKLEQRKPAAEYTARTFGLLPGRAAFWPRSQF